MHTGTFRTETPTSSRRDSSIYERIRTCGEGAAGKEYFAPVRLLLYQDFRGWLLLDVSAFTGTKAGVASSKEHPDSLLDVELRIGVAS
jgi:hypothetical protein